MDVLFERSSLKLYTQNLSKTTKKSYSKVAGSKKELFACNFQGFY